MDEKERDETASVKQQIMGPESKIITAIAIGPQFKSPSISL